jgi:hypothetical protein
MRGFNAQAFFYKMGRYSHPAHQQVPLSVETVEKVTFQKLYLKSGRETLKSG